MWDQGYNTQSRLVLSQRNTSDLGKINFLCFSASASLPSGFPTTKPVITISISGKNSAASVLTPFTYWSLNHVFMSVSSVFSHSLTMLPTRESRSMASPLTNSKLEFLLLVNLGQHRFIRKTQHTNQYLKYTRKVTTIRGFHIWSIFIHKSLVSSKWIY